MVAPSPNAPSRASGGSNGMSDQSEKCTHSLFMSPFPTLISTIHEHLEAPCTSTHHPGQLCPLLHAPFPNQITIIKCPPVCVCVCVFVRDGEQESRPLR